MPERHRKTAKPDFELALSLPAVAPASESLSLDISLRSLSDVGPTLDRLLDVLGSAVAEDAGWRPIESED